MQSENILIIGANGQLGSVLTKELQRIYGKESVMDMGFKYENDAQCI